MPPADDGPIDDLDRLRFDNRFVAELPGDPDPSNRRRQVLSAAYSEVAPTPVPAPRLLGLSRELLADLDVSPSLAQRPDFADVFAGNRVPRGARPFAMNYGGHQFGSWAGQLGDGRAIALGEVLDATGMRQTLQLKGAGATPYSRSADGRAVLRSSIREFLCSEAMHHLGVPTTRALCLVATGEHVMRDVLYDGNPAPEAGAVVCRVAPSFVRFGTFELPASRGEIDLLEKLVAFTIRNDFPHLWDAGTSVTSLVPSWFDEVCQRTAGLLVDWMRIGFVHGVLNTDNMSILGLTIDYGPYGWLESFDPSWTPNTTDAGTRRYRYGAQPEIGRWNLLQLANALVALTEDPAPLQASLDSYATTYSRNFRDMTAHRLGWGGFRPDDAEPVAELFRLLQATEVDQVLFFRELARVPTAPDAADDALFAPLEGAWYRPDEVAGELRAAFARWLRAWGARARAEGATDAERAAAMDRLNPRFVLRNYLAAEVIDAVEAGDASAIDDILDVLRRPYDDQPGRERYAEKRPEWARHKVGCSMLSCSS